MRGRRGRWRRLLPASLLAGTAAFFLIFGSLDGGGPRPRLAGLAAGGRGEMASFVAEIVDGDTLRLGDGARVRLVQVDAPEAEGECYGRQAARALEALLPTGTQVRVVADPTLDRVDRYGRLLAYVYRDGVNVNLELVRRGAAAPYFYRGERGRLAGKLLSAARQARAEGRGLWSACPRTPLRPTRAVAARR